MPSCFTKFLSKVSPAKADFVVHRRLKDGSDLKTTHHRADPAISGVGHSILILIFYAAFIAYIVITSIDFANQTAPETNGMIPSTQLPAIDVDVTLTCRTGTCGQLSVVENYTAYPGSACHAKIGGSGIRTTPVVSGQTLRALLCYTGEDEWSVVTPGHLEVGMMQTIFSDLRGFGSVNVKSVSDNGASLNRDLGLDTTSVRALNIGAEVVKIDGDIESITVFPLQYQAEGFREGTNRSEILLHLVPLANVRNRQSGRTAWQLVADFGSAFSTLQMFFTILAPLWAVVFSVNNHRASTAAAAKQQQQQQQQQQQGADQTKEGDAKTINYDDSEEDDEAISLSGSGSNGAGHGAMRQKM